MTSLFESRKEGLNRFGEGRRVVLKASVSKKYKLTSEEFHPFQYFGPSISKVTV